MSEQVHGSHDVVRRRSVFRPATTIATAFGSRQAGDLERARSALRASEARSRELIRESAEGILVSEASGRYVEVNPAFCRMLGYSRRELLSMRAGDLTAADDPVGNKGMDERLAGAGGELGILVERRYRKRDGTSLPVEVRFKVLPDGRQQRNVRDISERMRAADALRTSEARMRGSLDAMLDPFMICSSVRDDLGVIAGFRIDFANRAAGAFMRRSADTLIGALIPDGMPYVGSTRFLGACRRVVETGERWADDAAEYTVPAPDGSAVQGVLSSQITRFNDGFLATWRDVTERERLARERERLAAIVEESADGIVTVGADKRLTYANHAFVADIGQGPRDLVGRAVADVMLDVLDPATVADVDRAITAGRRWVGAVERPNSAVDRRIGAVDRRIGAVDRRRADGTIRHVEVSVTPTRGQDGTFSSYVVVTRDVTRLREAEAELLLEARVRAATIESFHSISGEATLEQAATAICDELVKLPFIDMASIQIFLGPADVKTIALSAPDGYPSKAGDHLPPAMGAYVREHAAAGPWAGYPGHGAADAGWVAEQDAAGLRAVAYGPIGHGDHVAGVLLIGTFNERMAPVLVAKVPALVSFSATSSALLAERLHALRREADLREALEGVLASRAFHPVFQPIVDLASGEVVGYEANTRFDSGQPPSRCFADAWSVGLGPDMELATLEVAVAAARGLPAGRWLGLNISPRLLEDPGILSAALRPTGRPVVLEITEHDLIESYSAVHEAIRALGHEVRLAVDDAGAGVANFGHIIELRPDLVKLDISLVRHVNANLGRQAMVLGMRHFSRTAGCRLIAEGIETEDEARTLAGLGVEFGQGYLFGHPEPVEMWAAAGGAGGHPTLPPGAPPRDVV